MLSQDCLRENTRLVDSANLIANIHLIFLLLAYVISKYNTSMLNNRYSEARCNKKFADVEINFEDEKTIPENLPERASRIIDSGELKKSRGRNSGQCQSERIFSSDSTSRTIDSREPRRGAATLERRRLVSNSQAGSRIACMAIFAYTLRAAGSIVRKQREFDRDSIFARPSSFPAEREVSSVCDFLTPRVFPAEMFTYYYKTREAKPPPSWCDIKDLFPHDTNDNEKTVNAEGNYYANCDTSVWMRSCEKEVIEPIRSTEITGTIPKWLKGTLLRNGPGNLKVGKYRYQHLFDSSALLHRFGIADGEITYQRRFIQTEVYKRNMAAQRIVFNEFGTNATPDPCKTIFHRVAAIFNPNETLSDNSMISVYPFDDEYYTFTEAPVMHRIDPKNLETMGRINMTKYVNIVNHTSHPHVMADGTVYNVGLSITPMGPQYSVVCFSPRSVTVDDSGEEKELSMFDQATIVASVPSRWMLNPSYMHTFGITENFFIIVEQPMSISLAKMTMSHFKQEPMINSFKWHDNETTLIHVISRNTGQVVKTFVAETFFYLHIINQFETRDKEYIVLDVCCYRNPKMLECMYIDAMKSMHGNADFSRLFRARPLRFVLPMRKFRPDTPPEQNLITIKTVHQSMDVFRGVNGNESVERRPSCDVNGNDDIKYDDNAKCWRKKHKGVLAKKATAHRLLDGRIFVKPELLCDVGCETPRINTDFHLGREYRYFYAISCDMDLDNPGTLIKVDTVQKTKKIWQENGVYPSEPIFVPDPKGKNEDDGVVVSALVWAKEETRVGLLILDAVTFTEIARTTFDTPGPVPKCLHGWFSLDK